MEGQSPRQSLPVAQGKRTNDKLRYNSRCLQKTYVDQEGHKPLEILSKFREKGRRKRRRRILKLLKEYSKESPSTYYVICIVPLHKGEMDSH